ncbi:hypothetical protein HYH03_013715 [Edaphochlamys debaryana]|uniref:Uncharacterized protein n=1 Tax=Edaphochlamys debaryana TaxID=47281 RepID=A0A835XT32_9CHLO|nr:hypothetical protein HYH03_013715 [Edaphochlamys debaryana]|eukprot:KAG2487716.1 hypothetical protein HYH03_013715 [Edaphochlamys debaryana]
MLAVPPVSAAQTALPPSTGAFECIVNVWPPQLRLCDDGAAAESPELSGGCGECTDEGAGSSLSLTEDASSSTYKSQQRYLSSPLSRCGSLPYAAAGGSARPDEAMQPENASEPRRRQASGLSAALKAVQAPSLNSLRVPARVSGASGPQGLVVAEPGSIATAVAAAAAPSAASAASKQALAAASGRSTSRTGMAPRSSRTGLAGPVQALVAAGGNEADAAESVGSAATGPATQGASPDLWDRFSPSDVDRLWAGGSSLGTPSPRQKAAILAGACRKIFGKLHHPHARAGAGEGSSASAGGPGLIAASSERPSSTGMVSGAAGSSRTGLEPGGSAAGATGAAGPAWDPMTLLAAAAAAAPAPRALGGACAAAPAGGAAGDVSLRWAPKPPRPPKRAPAEGPAPASQAAQPQPQAAPSGSVPPSAAAAAADHPAAGEDEEMTVAVSAWMNEASGIPGLPPLLHGGPRGAGPAAEEAPAFHSLLRGHIHNGPRLPLGGSPVSSQHRTSNLGSATGSVCCSGAHSPTVLAAAAAAAAVMPPGEAGVADGTPAPDSPLSQASTVWEHPQALGTYVVRSLHRPRWPPRRAATAGRRESEGSASSGSGIVAGSSRDARTQWWGLTGHFDEAENERLRVRLWPHERPSWHGSGGAVPPLADVEAARRRKPWWQRLLRAG